MSIAELKQQIILELDNADEPTLLQVQNILHPENESWESLPEHLKNDITISLNQIENGQTKSYDAFKNKHFK
jgi:hypothetical protein